MDIVEAEFNRIALNLKAQQKELGIDFLSNFFTVESHDSTDLTVSVSNAEEFPEAGLGRLITLNSELNGAT